jgi:competence protein ComEC
MRKVLHIVMIVGLVLFVWRVIESRKIEAPRVSFLDVNQGDAILVQLEGGFDILIDGGPDTTVVQKLGEQLPYFDRTIELIVVSHPDADHVNGLAEVARRYRVERVLYTGVADELPAYNEFQKFLRQENTKELFALAGQTFELPGGTLTVLSPSISLIGQSPEDSNTYSVVVRLDVGGRSFVFTGDADLRAEEEILAHGFDVKADVLKAGHHGSKSATGEAWLEAVQPAIGVISAGRDNHYGHPHQEVLDRLKRHGVQVVSTAESGDLCLMVMAGELQRCY